MANKGFNYDFRLYLEGVKTPFKSAMIVSTPNGTEANINLFSNRHVYDLKPKTSVQVFYKDIVDLGGGRGWRLMFDGFTSGFVKEDHAEQGRGLALKCRDFRMDIRRTPAAISYQGVQELAPQVHYNQGGLRHTITDSIRYPNQDSTDAGGVETRTYDNTGIHGLADMIMRIAGTASGKTFRDKRNQTQQLDGEAAYLREFNNIPTDREEVDETENENNVSGAFFLDAVVRGMWSESVGGTSMSAFINKRARVDKRFLVPKNRTGYSFWFRNNFGLEVGSVMMGNSRFSSLEAAIMRVAGLFSVRVYSCSTPSLIPVKANEKRWIMDKDVEDYLVTKNPQSFGAPFILNESMLLPPMEFTAPPNSNLIFPPMYDRISWDIDTDSDITRGYFKKIDTLSVKGNGPSLKSGSVQIPTTLFEQKADQENTGQKGKENEFDSIRVVKKPPLTLEERYKGVSLYNGSVEVMLAKNDAARQFMHVYYNQQSLKKATKRYNSIKSLIKKINKKGDKVNDKINKGLKQSEKDIKRLKEERNELDSELEKLRKEAVEGTKTNNSLNRHALIKYLNRRYGGRVAEVEMQFNPYVTAGFPSIVMADDESYGGESMRSIIGMVQVVKHSIYISGGASGASGDARTAIRINNARFIDEPTDMDKDGMPLYMKATNPQAAKLDENLEYEDSGYLFPEGKAPTKRETNNNIYEIDQINEPTSQSDYRFARDFLTLSAEADAGGEKNSNYLDDDYMPNRISRFYKDILREQARHFMIGESGDADSRFLFMYDTIHEAADALRKKKDLFSDYSSCLKYVARDVCSADAFYMAIVGASIQTNENSAGKVLTEQDGVTPQKKRFKVFTDQYKHTRIFDKYHGITSDLYESSNDFIEARKEENGGTMTAAGQFSSIREHLPITAFIKERRDAVNKYLNEVNRRVSGVQYANK